MERRVNEFDGSPTISPKPGPQATVANASPDAEIGRKEESKSTKASPKRSRIPEFYAPVSWLTAVLTIVAYSLTVTYALGNTGILQISWLALNPSRTITVLRTLSEMTALLTVALVGSTAERLQWMLSAREHGVSLPGFLSLGSGTSHLGMIKLLFPRTRGARCWSLSRLAMLLVVPLTSIVLLSRVDMVLVFHGLDPFPVAAGVGKFDASYAGLWEAVTPTYMTTDLSSLLQNREWTYPTSPISDGIKICSTSTLHRGNEQCGSSFFLHGGTKMVTPWPTENTSQPDASAYTLEKVPGLHLDFQSLVASAYFDGAQDCIVVGEDKAAIQICISSSENNTLNSKFLHCPLDFQNAEICLKNTTWQSSTGWTTTLQVYNRRGTVQFSRSNLTSLAITELSAPTPTAISSAGLLAVFNTTFKTTSSSLSDPFTAGPSATAMQFITFLSTYLAFAETSSPSYAEAGLYLRNLLVLPLFYFQPTYLSPITYNAPFDPNSILKGLPAEHYIQASFAKPVYQLEVAPWTVWFYLCAMGCVILVCLAVLVRVNLSRSVSRIPDTTSWPVVDFVASCQAVDDGKGLVETMGDVKKAKGKERARLMEELRICVRT